VVLAFGCSGALFNAISVLCEAGDNLLVPAPGFPLALPIAQNLGINLKYYNLLVSKNQSLCVILNLTLASSFLAGQRVGNRPRAPEESD